MARIILGITGSIVAYNGADLARFLIKRGHEVRALVSSGGQKFITPLTMQALTGHRVPSDQWQAIEEDGLDHIHMARWADLIVVAPASADFLAKAAGGLADELLTTVLLAFDGPLFMAPAMNTKMLENPATLDNISILKERGVHFVDSEEGRLVCGEQGSGRMAEVDDIAETVCDFSANRKDYSGVRAIVTAGPTVEPIDPVRIVTNRSSGRMGFEIAKALDARGANVSLITGPTTLDPPANLTETVFVDSTAEMESAVRERFEETDLLVMAAAVADWRPVDPGKEKKPRNDGSLTIDLEPTVDILEGLSNIREKQAVIGFALETEDLVARGRAKRERKNLDAIGVNNPLEQGAGPYELTNRITLIHRDGRIDELPLQAKEQVAHRLLDAVRAYVQDNSSG